MHRLSLCLVVSLTACQALTDPCFQAEDYDGPDKCVGTVTADLEADPPTFSMEGTSEVEPNEFSIDIAEGDPCDGSTRLWEASRLLRQVYPISYGVLPEGAQEWKNEDLLVDGQLPPLIDGTSYIVSFGAGDRLGSGAIANLDWSGVFVAGDADSFELLQDRCF